MKQVFTAITLSLLAMISMAKADVGRGADLNRGEAERVNREIKRQEVEKSDTPLRNDPVKVIKDTVNGFKQGGIPGAIVRGLLSTGD